MKTLWINARFIDRPITGVERVAREVTRTLLQDVADENGVIHPPEGQTPIQLRLIAPRTKGGTTSFAGQNIERRSVFKVAESSHMKAVAGHLWEQSDLPWITRGDAVLNLCNTGPVLKRNQYLFLHDAQPFAIPENFNRLLGAWYRFSYKTGARMSRKVLVNSQFTKSELLKYVGGDERKFAVCPLGCDHILRLETESLDRPLPHGPYIVAFASENPNKNFALIMKAMQLLGDSAPTCLVIGKAAHRIFSTTAFIHDKVLPLGGITDGQLVPVLQQALALVYPSFYEGFGLPPLEAMALSCPTIVSNTGALNEVTGASALKCAPTDARSLAKAIQSLLKTPAIRNVLQRQGVAHAEQFTWTKCAESILDAVYDQTSNHDHNHSLLINPSH